MVYAGLAGLACTTQTRERPGSPEPSALVPVAVEGQPLASNIQRLIEALQFLGAPLPASLRADLG